MTITPKDRAQRAATALLAGDRASAALGFELLEADEGRAVMAMTIRPDHVNGHGICHGGIIFALADSAFAVACNSRNVSTVAQHNTISYLRPARLGDRLTARATEVSLAGRSGITDVTVRDAKDEVIAQFRGASRAISGQLFKEDAPQ